MARPQAWRRVRKEGRKAKSSLRRQLQFRKPLIELLEDRRLLNADYPWLFPGYKLNTVGTAPNDILTADFNGDGFLDLVTTNSWSDDVSVLLGNGDGTFQAEQRYAVGVGPESVSVGDFNGDGFLDLVTANSSSDDVSVLLGNGDGTFQAEQRYAVGDWPSSVAVGDFNGDGFLDLVTANSGSDDVSVLLGNGDGTFQAEQRYTVGDGPSSVAVGDFNGDGFWDLVTANADSDDVSVLLGNGDGTFQAEQRYVVGDWPFSVAVGDFNGDAFWDLVTANESSDDVSVLLGNGDGTFQAEQRYAVGYGPSSVAVGDFNGDGFLDLVTANGASSDVSVLLNLSAGAGWELVDLGQVDDDLFSGFNAVEMGSTVLQVTPVRDGFLTILAGDVELPDSLVVRLYDDNPFANPGAELLAESVVVDGQVRLDYEAVEGSQPYFVTVSGTDTDFSLRFVNLVAMEFVSEIEVWVSIFGTEANDTLELRASPQREVVINGVSYVVEDFSGVTVLTVTGDLGQGYDAVVAYDGPGDDVFDLRPGLLTAVVSGNPTIRVEGLMGFEEAHVYATQGGQDLAKLYDRVEDGGANLAVKLKSEPEYPHVKLIGSGMYHRVKFFEMVEAYAEGDNDKAIFHDSSGDDVLEGGYGLSRMFGADYDVSAHNFRTVTAYASGGNDTARLVDSVFKDEFRSWGHKSELFDQVTNGDRYRVTVRAFDYVYAEASPDGGGRDVAKFWATLADDLVEISDLVLDFSVIKGGVPQLIRQVRGFESVKLQPTTGSNDRVRITEPVGMEYTIGSGWIVE